MVLAMHRCGGAVGGSGAWTSSSAVNRDVRGGLEAGRSGGFAVSCAMCVTGQDRFDVKYAPSFLGSPIRVSVLGVYRDGLLSEADSATLASEMSRVLRPSVCPPGYGEVLQRLNVDAWSAIQARVERDGVGDELLGAIAAAAEGDYILVVEAYGRFPAPSAAADAPARRVLVAHGGPPTHSDGRPTIGLPKAPDLELSASIFSVQHRSTEAFLSLAYAGSSVGDAIQRFASKLSTALPGTRCGGWKWGFVRVVREQDMAGLSLTRFQLVPVTSD